MSQYSLSSEPLLQNTIIIRVRQRWSPPEIDLDQPRAAAQIRNEVVDVFEGQVWSRRLRVSARLRIRKRAPERLRAATFDVRRFATAEGSADARPECCDEHLRVEHDLKHATSAQAIPRHFGQHGRGRPISFQLRSLVRGGPGSRGPRKLVESPLALTRFGEAFQAGFPGHHHARCPTIQCTWITFFAIAYCTNWALLWIPNLRMRLNLCASIVLTLKLKSIAISLTDLPSASILRHLAFGGN